MRRGQFAMAEHHLRASIARLTERNPNPYDGEPFYNLGLTLVYQGRVAEAYDAFYKATWNAGWRGPAYHRLAEIDGRRGDWATALEHVDRSLRAEADGLNARNLKAVALRRLGRDAEAERELDATCALDPLDVVSRFLRDGRIPVDGQQRLDLIFDLVCDRGWRKRRSRLPQHRPELRRMGRVRCCSMRGLRFCVGSVVKRRDGRHMTEAMVADPAWVFPSRLEEMLLLEEARDRRPDDARARYYLGNLLYDRRRHEEAIVLWEAAAALEPSFATVWRNLGFGYYNVRRDPRGALDAFAHARECAPSDARILYEQDQLLKRTGALPAERLRALEADMDLVKRRDDLAVEFASLSNSTGQPGRALDLLLSRRFQPWEGGEGMVLAQYVRSHLLLGLNALGVGEAGEALRHFERAMEPPDNLSEVKHPLTNLSVVDFWMGVARERVGDPGGARVAWERAAANRGDFQEMAVQVISESTYWSGMGLRRLGRLEEAKAMFERIRAYAQELEQTTPKIDFFATSLPAMLLFEEDLKARQDSMAQFLRAQAVLGLGEREEAEALLRQVLESDRSHIGAADLLSALATGEL